VIRIIANMVGLGSGWQFDRTRRNPWLRACYPSSIW